MRYPVEFRGSLFGTYGTVGMGSALSLAGEVGRDRRIGEEEEERRTQMME